MFARDNRARSGIGRVAGGDRAIRLALAAIVVLLYGPSLGYGLIWDDPEWFSRVAASGGTAAFGAIEGYGFFRPLTVLWHGLFVTADGRVLGVPLHAAQVAWHLGSTLLVHALARRWLPGRAGAAIAAATFAMLPFAQQSVAWAGAHQPASLFFTLMALSLWLARGDAGDVGRLGLGSLVAYTIALGLHEAAAPLALAIWLAAIRPAPVSSRVGDGVRPTGDQPGPPHAPGRDRVGSGSEPRRPGALAARIGWPPPHVALAAIFVAWRAALPLASEHVGGGMELRSLGMLLQPVAWPVTRALALVPPVDRVARSGAELWMVPLVVTAAMLTWFVLARWVARHVGPSVAVWASAWIGIAIASAWLGLGWSYVRHAPRLGYTASVGVALLWGALAGGLLATSRRTVAAAAIAGLLARCAADTLALNRMHAAAAAVVDQATEAVRHGDALLVNAPDRLLPRRPPYPLGDWDVIAMPVALEVADFARARFGATEPVGSDVSRFAPAHGFDEREALPWWIDHRGEAAGPETLVELAGDGRAVHTIRWAGGRPDTRYVGRLLVAASGESTDQGEEHGSAASRSRWSPPGAVLAAGFGARGLATAPAAVWPVARPPEAITAASVEYGEIRLIGAAAGGRFRTPDPGPGVGPAERTSLSPLWLRFERRGAPPPASVTIFVHHVDSGGALALTADGDAWDGLLPPHAWPDGMPLVDGRRIDPLAAFGAGELRVGFYARGGERLQAHLGDWEGPRAPEDAVRLVFDPSAVE